MAIDYKQKYLDIKAKFISSMDTSYRIGYEQGQKDAQLQNLQQQQEMQQQQMAQMQQQMMGGMQQPDQQEDISALPPEEQAAQFEDAQNQEMVDNGVSELEQGIAELSELLGKSESDKSAAAPILEALAKSLKNINTARQAQELKKNLESIKKIAKSADKTKKLSISFEKNAKGHQKQALNMQQRIVSGIMEKWEKEEEEASKDILSALKLK